MTDSTNNPAEIRDALERDQEAEDQAVNGPANAAELPALTDDECDKIAARTMDQVAAAKGLEHAVYLVTDIAHSHTLRRELIRSGARAALSTQSAPARVALTDEQIKAIAKEADCAWMFNEYRLSMLAFARAIHGITASNKEGGEG